MVTSPQKRLIAEMDVERREAERRAFSGDVDAQQRELIDKMRSGELTRERVKLLSYLGYGPAGKLMPTTSPVSLENFIAGLRQFDNDVVIRAAIISARAALPVWEAEFPDDDRPRKAIEAAESGVDIDAAYYAVSNATERIYAASLAAWDISTPAPGYSIAYAAAAAVRNAVVVAADISKIGIDYGIAKLANVITWTSDAGVENVRELIQQGLIKWVLNDN